MILPEVIFLEGPQTILNTMPNAIPISLPVRNLDRNYEDDIEVIVANDLIERNPPVVHVSFPVERFRAVADTVALQVINLPKGVRAVNTVREVGCVYSLPVSTANAFSQDSVRAVLNLYGLKSGNHKLVPVVLGLPAYSQVVKVDTIDVSF
jgi:hypothetical protein